MVSPHHRVASTSSLHIEKTSSTQLLQELSFHLWYCSQEIPGLLGSLTHHHSWHHGYLGYFFMPRWGQAHPQRALRWWWGHRVRRNGENSSSPDPSLPSPCCSISCTCALFFGQMLTVTFCVCSRRTCDSPNVYIFYCLTQQTYWALFCKALDKMQSLWPQYCSDPMCSFGNIIWGLISTVFGLCLNPKYAIYQLSKHGHSLIFSIL